MQACISCARYHRGAGRDAKVSEMVVRDAKSRLVEAALDLMGRRGIAQTSTREILAAAGIRNPSAISYHFGSKAELVEAIAGEIVGGQFPILGQQIELVEKVGRPSATEWVQPYLDTAITLVSTERGCLLARIWWEYDGYFKPQSLERFMLGDSELVVRWRAALRQTFPDIAPKVAVARNVTALRTIGWMLARMANIALQDDPFREDRAYVHFRRWLQEITVTLVGAPSELEDADVEGPRLRGLDS
jgi:AcrR family transcriptional regulator